MEEYFTDYSIERINSIKSLHSFCEKIINNKSEKIINLLADIIQLIQDDFITDLINYELSQLNKYTEYIPSPSSFNFLTLFDCKYCSLFLFSRNNEDFINTKTCSSYGADRLIVGLNKEGISYNRYLQDNPYPIDILDFNKKLSGKCKDQTLSSGEVLYLQKDVDILSYNYSNLDNTLLLALFEKPEGQYVWEYDNATLLPIKIVAGNYQSTSRLEQSCNILGEFGNLKSLDRLFSLIKHNDYNVRWEAAKAIMLIDFDEGLKALKELESDAHPVIRKAVINAFNKIQPYLN